MNLSPIPDANLHPCLDALSPREQQVFLAIACGEPRDITFARLGIGAKTVDTYRARVLDKLDLYSNQHITAYAMTFGLLAVELALPVNLAKALDGAAAEVTH